MQLHSLEIKRTGPYDTPASTLQCTVTLIGPAGKQSLILPPAATLSVLEIAEKSIGDVALLAAKAAEPALQNAAQELRDA